MISGCSDCSRVDAVKATAHQLKLQVPHGAAAGSPNANVQAANRQLQSVDAEIRSGDASKAEVALAGARSAVEQIQYAAPTVKSPALQGQTTRYGGLDIHA
jgi:hypothetical protein